MIASAIIERKPDEKDTSYFDISKREIRLMSDNSLLTKSSTFKNGKLCWSSNWTVMGKLKDGMTAEQWIEYRTSKGFTITRS